MFKKSILSLIAILTCCALTCVGFSAWVIVGGGNTQSSTRGTISADDVIYSNEYVSTYKESIVIDDYTPTGFKSKSSGSITTTGIISATFTIDVDLCKSKLGNNLIVEIDLKFSDNSSSNLFSGDYISVSITDTSGVATSSSNSPVKSQTSYKVVLDLDLSQTENSKLTFTLTYTLTMGSNYMSLIYDKFNSDANAQFAFVIVTKNS